MAGTRNPWDENYSTEGDSAGGGNPWEQAYQAPEKPEGASLLRKAGDLGLSVTKGVVAMPEAAVGLADIPTGGRVGKFLENEGGAFGFRPKQAKEYLSSLQSDDLQSKQKQFQQADGVLDKAGVALSNPSLIANAVAESVPLMGAGAVPARALLAAAPRVGAAAAGAIGEGVVGAGSAAEASRQETQDGLLTPTQSGLAAATGAATSAFGFAGGKVAQRLGIGDVDTMFAQGAARAAGAPSAKSIPRQVVEGAIAEGWLEELPQSVSEQVLQNLALNKPWHEGVSDAAVMGTLAGMAMGGGAAGVAGFSQPTPEQTPPPNQPAPVPPPVTGPTLALPAPDRGVIQVAGDGTARTPAYQAPGYVGDVTDVEPRAVNPVREQVATAAEQGGALSSAALTAIDTGLSDAMQPAPEQAPPQISLEEADARDRAAYEQFFASHDSDPVVSRYFENDDDIPDFDAASNASEEDFLRALGATDEDIQDAIATSSQSAIPQSSVASNAGPQAYEPAGPREGAGEGAASQAGQVNAGAIQQAAPDAPVSGVGGTVGADGAGSAAASVSGASGPGGAGTGAATGSGAGATEAGSARAGGRGDGNQALSAPANLRDALVRVRQQKQEAANAQAAQAPAPAAAPVPGPAAAPAVEAAGPALNIKAITAKQIPDMTDAELQAAIEHYGPAHKRTAKLQKEAQRRAAPIPTTPTTTQGTANVPQASQAQQASQKPTQAAAAPAAGPAPTNTAAPAPAGASTVRALSDGTPAENTGAQAAPAAGAQGAAPAEPEFTTIKTVVGDSVTVRTADLNSDKPRLRQYTKDGKSKAVPAIHRDNLDLTGDKRAASAKEDADNPFFNVITTKNGSTFANQAAASRELNRLAMGKTHEVVAASEVQDGARGFVIRRKRADAIDDRAETGANQAEATTQQAPAATEPVAQPITRADVEDAQQQAATLIAERIDAMTAGEVNTIARRFLPTMGVKPTVSKERNKAAVTDFTKVNPMAAAAEFGVTLPADVRRALEAEMQGKVADGVVEPAAAKPAAAKPAAAPQPAAPAAPIEDAGEKIGGARKDRWKERGLNLDDLDAMTEAEGAELATKANVWKPDYEALAAQSEPVTAAMVKTIYDQLAAKPKKNTPEGRRQYVQMMRIVRDVLTEAKGPEAVRNAYLEIRKRAGLNAADPAAKAAGRELLFSVYKGRSDPFVLGYTEMSKAKKLVEDGFPAKGEPWKTRLSVGRAEGGAGTTERGIEIYMERSAEVGTPLTREQILDGFYRVSTKDNKTVAFAASKADAEAAAATVYERDMKGKKDGKPEPVRPNLDELKRENLPQRIDRDVTSDDFVRDLGFRGVEFGNWSAQDERQRILNMAYDGLMDLAEIMGVPPKAMSLNGTLGMAFGARGGGRFAAHYEPGKLVINMTKIRGGGSMAHEWAHAMDHYFGELDKPDAYTTQARGASGWYTEDQYNGVPRRRMERVGNEWKNVEKMRLDNLRPEMAAAFDEVMRALFQKQITKAEMVRSQELDLERTEALARSEQDAEMKAMYQNMVQNKREALNELRNDPEGKLYAGRGRSDYAQQAQALSGKSVDGYWVRPTEMFARAFESWVFDRVTAMGARSDYLVHGVEEDRFAGGGYKGNPYPTGEERARINAAFDKLTKTIKTKETDTGNVAMFSRAPSPTPPADSNARNVATQLLIDGLKAKWTRAPEIIVARNMQDAQIPQEVRDYDALFKSQGATGEPRGFIYQGKVYLLSDELKGPQQIAEVLFHEVLGHYGLHGAFGDSLNSILQQMGTMRRRDVVAKAREYGLFNKDALGGLDAAAASDSQIWAAMSNKQRLDAAEEVLAEMAQTQPTIGFVQRAIAAIRNWLRANVPGFKNLKLTDAEIIRSYIIPARGFVERGRSSTSAAPAGRGDFEPAFSLGDDAGKKVLAEFAKADELFALPKSGKDTVAGIADDIDSKIAVRVTRLPGETMYTLNHPDFGVARITERTGNPYGPSLYGYNQVDGEITDQITERPGENPEDVDPRTGDVWLDVSLLKPGQGGEKVYAIATNYAHNTGKIFIGDPAGLSTVALRRRLEQMLSSALKFGTTAHLAPHPDQVRGGDGVPPLRWVYGDDVGNVERMIAVSVKALDNAMPTSKLIAYDPDRGFYRTDTGRSLARGQLAFVLKRSASEYRLAHGAGAAGQAGWRTIARAALFRHLQTTPIDGARQLPERGGLLARAGEDVSRLGRGRDGGEAFGADERIFYSRTAGAGSVAEGGTQANFAGLAATARKELNRTFGAPGKLSWWHKTIGTMNNLAERSPAFKKVFDAAQGFIDDVSYYANDAAELAPKLLPKLETWRDITKRPITAEDNTAIAKPINEGTLIWTRDEDGKPVKLQAVEDAAAKMTAEQKAQQLLRQNKISEGMLKAWQGLPVEQYEKLVASRYESQVLQAGIVWTPAELKSVFGLNDAQVSLYQEFRAATDRSLDTMARADMLRYGGKDVAELRDMVMDAPDAQDAAKILRDHLQMLAKEDPGRAGELSQLSSGMLDRAARVQELQEQGYAPLSRFGKYTVDVVDANGERQYFGLFETQREANIMAMKMRKGFGQDAVSQGTLSNEEFKLLAGITPESLELFGNMLGLDSTGDDAQDQAFQEYLRRTKTNRSAMRRLIHRQGIAGYSEDVGRVLASFIYSNARQTSAGLHMGELGEAVTAIPKQQGELKDAAVQLSEYVKNPQEEAQAIRGLLFAQYLGGSIASAVVNMSQPAAVTFPWLSQFGGAKQAATELGRAAKNLANKAHRYEADLAAALKQAEEEGTVSPQEVHQLMAQARGSGSLRPGDGTRTGDALASAGNALTRLSLAWGKVFGAAEQVNRRMTFIAAYRVAKAQGMTNPAAFAKKAVIETQFTYSKANKMKWGRGAVGATVMTFKTYSVAYLELLGRMWSQGGPEGKKAVLLALGMLMLMGGAGGLPFAEDAEDLVDGLAQLAGYNFNSKKAKQELLESVFGQAGAGFVERGITGLPGMPLDVSGRLGMGNLLPGTGIFKEKTDHTRDVLEVVGPVGDLAKRAASGARSILAGDVGAGLLQIAPAAVRNAAKGADMAATGMYRDDKGYKVLDTSPAEAAMKAIGFQPASVAKVQEANFINQQAKNFYNMKAQEIRAKWARGIFEKDQGIVAEARADLDEWNRKNPEQRIVVSMPAVLKRVREMSKTKDQRIADTAPRAMRQQMREEAEKARATL